MKGEQTLRTEWGADTFSVSANWSEASCPVDGLPGRQVADFSHSPYIALREVLRKCALIERMDDEVIEDHIEVAMNLAEFVEDDDEK